MTPCQTITDNIVPTMKQPISGSAAADHAHQRRTNGSGRFITLVMLPAGAHMRWGTVQAKKLHAARTRTLVSSLTAKRSSLEIGRAHV